MTNVLFVCSRNQLRSPTAEHIFASWDGLDVASAGLDPKCGNPLTPDMLEWSDVVFVMERTHQRKLSQQFRAHLKSARVICLGIADDYAFMDPALIALLEARVPRHLR